MLVDARPFDKLNMYPLTSGELAVRPGLRRIATPSASRTFVGGFSVINPFTPEVWHYVFDVATTTPLGLKLTIYDENFVAWQTFTIGANVVPRVITHAVVAEQLLICSPDFPTIFGMVGSGVRLAVKVDPDTAALTALEVPRGIVTAWNNRAVIADGNFIYVSDAVADSGGDVRTFVAQNKNGLPAPIYGIHQAAGGALVACTQAGVFGLDGSASAVDILDPAGTAWQLLNHHESFTYGSSCVVRGRVYVLTRKGYMLADTENDTEEQLNQQRIPRLYGPRIASNDWRTSRMYHGDEGPYVADTGILSAHDLDEQVRSWWRCSVDATFNVRGVLRNINGDEMLLCEDGVYMMDGNMDGGQLLSSIASTQPKGILAGLMRTEPAQNPTVREVQCAASLGGVGLLYAAVRGNADTTTLTPVADNRSLVIGTSSWGASGKVYQDAPLASVRAQFDINTDEVTIEVGADFPSTKLSPAVNVDVSKSAPDRPVPRGNTVSG